MNPRPKSGSTNRDSISQHLSAWMAELPGVDADVEAARQRVVSLARLLERGLMALAVRHGLSLGDWEALSALQRSGAPYEGSPKGLAAQLGVTSGTMSVRIERLTQAGLVEPGRPGSDGRSRPVRLTKRGQERWRAATADRTATEARLFDGVLGADELAQLNAMLATLLLHFEEQFGPAPEHGAIGADRR